MFVLCYSIYKVQNRSFLDFVVRSELLYSSTSFEVCQELFSSFSSFFSMRSVTLSSNFDILAHLFKFVKSFFDLFQTFLLCCLLSSGRLRPSSDSLHTITPGIPFVKHFFTIFSIFFCVFSLTTNGSIWKTNSSIPAGKAVADLHQGVSGVITALFPQRQVPQAYHAAQFPILHHRQPPDLSAPHQPGCH